MNVSHNSNQIATEQFIQLVIKTAKHKLSDALCKGLTEKMPVPDQMQKSPPKTVAKFGNEYTVLGF